MPRRAVVLSPRDRHIYRLLRELGDVQDQRSLLGLSSPIAAVAVGGYLLLNGVGAIVFIGELTSWHPDDAEQAVLVFMGVSLLAGITLVLRGLTVLDDRLTARAMVERRAREIKRELGGYGVFTALQVQPVASGAVLSGTVRF